MEKNKNILQCYPLFLLIVFLIGIIFFKFFIFSPFVDTGREFLIPKAILEGEVLYKDILNIYGALPYFISALFCKIFGLKLPTFLLLNSIVALSVVFGIYMLSNEFLSRKKSFIISLCIIFLSVFNLSLFNFIYPYSICYTMGLSALIYSILFLVKFFKTDNSKSADCFLAFSFLTAGFSVASKSEFFFLPFLILFILIFYRKINLKNFICFLGLFFFFPLLQCVILYFSGLDLNSALEAVKIILKSSFSPSMIEFHNKIGMQFNFLFLKNKLSALCFWVLVFALYHYFLISDSRKKKIAGYFLFGCVVLLFKGFFNLKAVLFFFPLLLLLLGLWNIKKIAKSPEIFLLFLAAIFASLKTFFYLQLSVYGAYTVILLLVLFFVLIYKILKCKSNVILNLVLIYCFITFPVNIFAKTAIFSEQINSYDERVETSLLLKDVSCKIIAWAELNTDKNDKIIIFPEGEVPIYLLGRKTDYFLYCLHDIFIETLGEDFIKKRILESNVKFIFDVSDFKFDADILSKHTYKTDFIKNLLKDEFTAVDMIPVSDEKSILIFERNK